SIFVHSPILHHTRIIHHYTYHTISPLSLHDALPISLAFAYKREPVVALVPIDTHQVAQVDLIGGQQIRQRIHDMPLYGAFQVPRSEEHTSELQSHLNIVCRLLLEKIKTIRVIMIRA